METTIDLEKHLNLTTGFFKKNMEDQRDSALKYLQRCQETIQRQQADTEKRLSRLQNDLLYTEEEKKIEAQEIIFNSKLYIIKQEQSVIEQQRIIELVDASLQTLSA